MALIFTAKRLLGPEHIGTMCRVVWAQALPFSTWCDQLADYD